MEQLRQDRQCKTKSDIALHLSDILLVIPSIRSI
uniref:Uncharacterized protein n=1 Tax=Myoviridae sp. ctzyI3 TaxID=2826722 RepID=A0A8S5MLW6_9CAUD|nr:MAG TPA: hypothetical protein [Myoviridae sp. ctzyI3]